MRASKSRTSICGMIPQKGIETTKEFRFGMESWVAVGVFQCAPSATSISHINPKLDFLLQYTERDNKYTAQ